MTNGAYAGPVTEGKTDVTVCIAPSSRSDASAGMIPRFIASARLSGRAPSATIIMTGNCSSGDHPAARPTFPERWPRPHYHPDEENETYPEGISGEAPREESEASAHADGEES